MKALIWTLVALAAAGVGIVCGVTGFPFTAFDRASAQARAIASYSEPAPSPVAIYKPVGRAVPAAQPKLASEDNADDVAALWDKVPTPKLVAIASKWSDADLAPVVREMDPEPAAKLLSSLGASRAAKLSAAIKSATP